MSMKLTDRIKAPSRGDAKTVIAALDGPDAKDLEYVRVVYNLAPGLGIDFSVVMAQWDEETGRGTSTRWNNDLNPAGIGIPQSGTPQPFKISSGTQAAALHLSCLAMLVDHTTAIPVSLPLWPDAEDWLARVWAPHVMAGPPVATIDDLDIRWKDASGEWQATWAWGETEGDYGPQIVARGNALFPNLPDQTGQTPTPPAGAYSTDIPGLPGGPLVTTYPIHINLIPASNTYQRPGIKAANPRRSVQHGTDNASNSSARDEAIYFVKGAEGRQASIHATANDAEVWIVVPLDEVTWQAADSGGPGNMNGYSCEMMESLAIWQDPTRRDAMIRITSDFMGRIGARLGVSKPEQHADFNWGICCNAPCNVFCDDRHDCPKKLRYVTINGGLAWDIYAERWKAAKADELARMGGEPTPAPAPVPVTTYAKPTPIAALQGINVSKNDTAPGVVISEGSEFIFVADVVEAIRNTPRLQKAAAKAARVGPDIEMGERFIVSWLFKAQDGEWYYITPWSTRVRQKDTKRVSDAPLI